MNNRKTNAPKGDYKSVIFSGCAIDSNGVSVCNLSDYNNGSIGNGSSRYQVWSDKHKCYDIFYNIDDAVNKFLELKNKG